VKEGKGCLYLGHAKGIKLSKHEEKGLVFNVEFHKKEKISPPFLKSSTREKKNGILQQRNQLPNA